MRKSLSAYFRKCWFCSRRLSVFERGTKIQSDFCPTLVFYFSCNFFLIEQKSVS
ncbi:hypothetical protein D354_00513 [Enterococcus faecalis]|nr:hypothetical protein D354_00513 [Enterococcus faecalis]EPI29345.1 hypothetical protein D351_01501 [Enterococcus faecalis WKS-26-18-2]